MDSLPQLLDAFMGRLFFFHQPLQAVRNAVLKARAHHLDVLLNSLH